MSATVALAAPDDGQEPEQYRNIMQKAVENSADFVIVPADLHKRKRDYILKSPQECVRSIILKSDRERII